MRDHDTATIFTLGAITNLPEGDVLLCQATVEKVVLGNLSRSCDLLAGKRHELFGEGEDFFWLLAPFLEQIVNRLLKPVKFNDAIQFFPPLSLLVVAIPSYEAVDAGANIVANPTLEYIFINVYG